MHNLSLAIDGGHSMFKIRASLSSSPDTRVSLQIPTVVIPAIKLTNEQTRLRAQDETVEIDGNKFFFGETAKDQGRAQNYSAEHSSWIESTQHDVLVLGAWRKIMNTIGSIPSRIHLVMGLPAKYFAAQKDILRKRAIALLTPRLLPGQTLKVMVQSQADAPLQWYLQWMSICRKHDPLLSDDALHLMYAEFLHNHYAHKLLAETTLEHLDSSIDNTDNPPRAQSVRILTHSALRPWRRAKRVFMWSFLATAYCKSRDYANDPIWPQSGKTNQKTWPFDERERWQGNEFFCVFLETWLVFQLVEPISHHFGIWSTMCYQYLISLLVLHRSLRRSK